MNGYDIAFDLVINYLSNYYGRKSKDYLDYLGTYVVEIRYGYGDYKTKTRTILDIGADEQEWLDDWWEGQDCIYISGVKDIDSVYFD